MADRDIGVGCDAMAGQLIGFTTMPDDVVTRLAELADDLAISNAEITTRLVKTTKDLAADLAVSNEEIAARLVETTKDLAGDLAISNEHIAAQLAASTRLLASEIAATLQKNDIARTTIETKHFNMLKTWSWINTSVNILMLSILILFTVTFFKFAIVVH